VSAINAKDVIKYVAAPGIIPRVQRFFASGLGMIPFLIAQIYYMVRILPDNHVYLNPSNIGRFGVRHVIAEAADHISFKRQNWDKIFIFTVILSGLVMMVAQLALSVVAIVFDPVWAHPISNNIFVTPSQYTTMSGGVATQGELKDIAFILLDRVFGVPKFFCGAGDVCTSVLADGRWPFHVALHGIFKFYSLGLLMVATLIFLYFIVVIIGETAISGTPFGERFQNPWIPIRLVIALLLLTPVTYGYNIGQYIVLFTAKVGSSLATNGWNRFNNTIKEELGHSKATVTGESFNSMLGLPSTPDLSPLIQSMAMAHACVVSEWYISKDTISDTDKTPLYRLGGKENLDKADHPPVADPTDPKGFYVRPYFFKASQANSSTKAYEPVTLNTTFETALKYYGYGDITIRFGKLEDGSVKPVCGDVTIPITDRSFFKELEGIDAYLDTYGGGGYMHRTYYNLVKLMWFGKSDENASAGDGKSDSGSVDALTIRHLAQRMILKDIDKGQKGAELACKVGCDQKNLPSCTEMVEVGENKIKEKACKVVVPDRIILNEIYGHYAPMIQQSLEMSHQLAVGETADHALSHDILERGWGGAAIWYNKIGSLNGQFSTAVNAIPAMVKMPETMEKVKKLKAKRETNAAAWEIYNPVVEDKEKKTKTDLADKFPNSSKLLPAAMYNFLKYLAENRESYSVNPTTGKKSSSSLDDNIIITAINFVLGTQGVMDMRNEINKGAHPIAQLSLIGKGMIDATIRNIGISTVFSAGSGITGAFGNVIQNLSGMAQGIFSAASFVGITAGVTLYYIIPILPFVFFFFALGGWVKGIFEAMVGVPLWALAHMRLGGEGLPGEAASAGYFLIMEIFVRPILIVFGLIASTLIFAMEVRLLNIIWDLVVSNLGGSEEYLFAADSSPKEGAQALADSLTLSRSKVDQFFYTIIYTVVVYMMATSSFKLIDSIPDSIMRWSGQNVSAFGDQDKNPSEGLTRIAAQGGMMQGQRIIKAGQSAVTAAVAPAK